MKIEDLTTEQLEKLGSCESVDQIIEYVNSEGIELTDEQLEQVSGGWGDDEDKGPSYRTCPKCGSTHTRQDGYREFNYLEINSTYCYDCHYTWTWYRKEPAKQ